MVNSGENDSPVLRLLLFVQVDEGTRAHTTYVHAIKETVST